MKLFKTKRSIYSIISEGGQYKSCVEYRLPKVRRSLWEKQTCESYCSADNNIIRFAGGVDAMLDKTIDVENLEEMVRRLNEERNVAFSRNDEAEMRECDKIIEEYDNLLASGPIKATENNIKIILSYLNLSDWGGWKLPKTDFKYRCHQYDCGGAIVSTMILEKGIKCTFADNLVHKFAHGNFKLGYLSNYYRI